MTGNSMTLDEAYSLAKAIEGTHTFTVVAIGHFQMDPTKTMPWALSIIAIDGTKSMIWNEDDWRRVAVAAQPAEPKKTPTPPAKQKKTAVLSDQDSQLQLF
jgi:hypothetical protein